MNANFFSSSSQRLISKILLSILLLFFVFFFTYSQISVASQNGSPESVSLQDFQAVPDPIYSALLITLQSEVASGTLEPGWFGLLSWRQYEESWGIGTIGISDDYNIYSLERSFLVVLRKENGTWHGLTQQDPQFETWLNDSPEAFLAREAIPLLSRTPSHSALYQVGAIPLDLRFPWQDGQEWRLGPKGVHDINALDFIPHNSIAALDREVVAAYQGVVYLRCSNISTLQDYLVIRHPDSNGQYATEYIHLDRNTVNLNLGDVVHKGQVIGRILNFTQAPPSELPCSGPNSEPHVHFGVGTINSSGFLRTSIIGTVINGWTVNSNNCLTKENLSDCIGSYFNSSSGVVAGQVYNSSNQPIQSAMVKFSGNDLIRRETNTNVSGWYISPDVPPGLATITAVKDGASGSVNMTVIANQSQQAPNITLLNYCPASSGIHSISSILADCIPIDHDNALFIADITLPDGTIVSPNQAMLKTWRLRNIGTKTWESGYQLVFMNGNQMGSPNAINVPVTNPDNTADISVNLVAPSNPGSYTGYWRLRNPQGTYFGPTIWVNITVPDETTPPPANAIELNCTNCPATVPPGYTFRPIIRAQVNSGQLLSSRGDMLRNTDGNLFGAWPHVAVTGVVNTGESYNFEFYADNPIQVPDTPGIYQTKWRTWQNGQWAGSELTVQFQVQEGGGVNLPPYPPSLTGPGNWAVYTGNTGIVLNAQHNGDPDGDNVTHYFFEIFESAQNANSGWITGNNWSPQGLGYYGYQWRSKVRDSHGAESDWSETRHFTIYNPQLEVTQLEFVSLDSNGERIRIMACANNATTLKAQVNTANDGSDSGEWRTLKELGVPCFNAEDAPVWNTLAYESGPHRVRVLARGAGGWEEAAVREEVYTVPTNHRPSHPSSVLPHNQAYVDSRTITFKWNESLRATSYQLQASESDDYETLLLEQDFSAGTTQYTHTFVTDYSTVYWRVIATGPYGTNQSNQRFHIDLDAPTSTIASLPPVTTNTQFSVNWSGSDARSGLRWYHIQVRGGNRPDSDWSDWLVNTTKTAEIFHGQPGQIYYFRIRAMDKVGNWGDWPSGDGNTYTLVDPTAMPDTEWWDTAYATKRNLLILNNDSHTMPTGYPVRIRFDNTTTPSAAEIYNASVSTIKGDDVRILYNDQAELDRFVQHFTLNLIEIWFPLQASLSSGGTSNDYQIYYGNSQANTPPANVDTVFLPAVDSNTVAMWRFQEGSGSTISDSSGNGHNGTFVSGSWSSGLLGFAGQFNGTSSYVEVSHSESFRPGAITLEAWIYLTNSLNNNARIVDKERFEFRIHHDRKVQLVLKADGGDRVLTGSSQLSVNQWYHVAATFDGNNQMRVYLNGVLDGHSNSGAPPNNWSNAPLHIGREAVSNSGHFPGYIQHLHFSNVARTNFTYGRINVPPSVAAGAVIDPPTEGLPNLAILDLTAHPNPSGGILVQTIIQNQGERSTRNGFSTDLYINHLPTGPGDFTGSFQFWINDPIESGATITLTTIISDPNQLPGLTLQTTGTLNEVAGTFYAQADSTGVINESDNSNNIYTPGLEVCIVSPDPYENNDSWQEAGHLALNRSQTHNFHRPGDQDWFMVEAEAGETYFIWTFNLGPSADTYLYLYDTDGATLLEENDDHNNSLASYIEWAAPTSGQYYLLVKHWNPNVGGCGTNYTISFKDTPYDFVYLPIILR
jgi:hypothetical protein